MNIIKTTKKYLIAKKMAKQSFLQLDKVYVEQEKVLNERLKKYDK